MQGVLDLVWAHLLPAMATDPGAVLDEDEVAQVELANRLAGLRLEPPGWTGVPSVAAEVSGRTITLEPNGFGVRSVVVEPGPERTRITFRRVDGAFSVDAGHGAWIVGRIPGEQGDDRQHDPDEPPGHARAVAAAVSWPAPDTLVCDLRLIETPFLLRLTGTFDGSVVRVGADLNAWFGPTHLADVVGQVAGSSRAERAAYAELRQCGHARSPSTPT